jgi:hypothetical protein
MFFKKLFLFKYMIKIKKGKGWSSKKKIQDDTLKNNINILNRPELTHINLSKPLIGSK